MSHKNLGRGTVCQIDHCDIDGHSYAVKSVSEKSVSNICHDARLIRKCFLPALCWKGSLASSHVKGYDSTLSSFVQEGNLLTELKNTKTQGRVLAELSRTNNYSIPVPEESGLADYIQQIPVKFKVPEVAEDFSSSEALVMELIEGCSLDHRDSAIFKHFFFSHTVWGEGGELFDSTDAMEITRELWTLVEKVYMQAARQSNFLNGDFQEGNFMMKMEYDHICIYFIDHGNCITVDNFDAGAQAVLADCLLVDLFLFFHQRYHGKGQDDNLQAVSQYSELSQMASVMDLVTQPLTDQSFQPYTEFINEWRDVFDCQQESEFTLQRYGQEMTVGAICRDIYQLVQLHQTWSREAEHMNSEQDFIRGLLAFLSKAVKKYKHIDDTNRKKVSDAVIFSFDDYLYDKGCSESDNHLQFRVFKQIQAYRNLYPEEP